MIFGSCLCSSCRYVINTHILLVEAGKYIETGIELLDAGHWQTQYSLSLDLFEMSASVSWAQGELSKMERPLAEILSNAKEFGDTLIASSLSVQRFTALSMNDEAMKKCFRVLEELGEALPAEYDVPFVLSELSSLNESLQTVTAAQMKQLPLMADKNKLSAMKFLNLLGVYAFHHNPMLLHIASCRMVKLTLLHGFCDDSIVGLGGIGLTIVSILLIHDIFEFLCYNNILSHSCCPRQVPKY